MNESKGFFESLVTIHGFLDPRSSQSKRSTLSVFRSIEGSFSSTSSDTSFPVTGLRETPIMACPAATTRFS